VSPLAHAGDFTEKLALMPSCYQANDRKRPLPAPDARMRHGLPEDALVLCGFNQPFKISQEVFDCWCGLLKQRDDAVLWLLAWNESVEGVLKQEAASRGIDPQRLVFAPRVDFADHISRFALADVFIDSWPCNGHTTVSDALWASVPVVTYQGRTFASRVAASLLHNVGLPDLICDSREAYEQRVLALCEDAKERLAIREHLVEARQVAPLFDSAAYARDFGHLLERMMARHREGLAPDHLV
jgi:predicted O-linked N-acetylglucosamine transferase (SPINDLY family)